MKYISKKENLYEGFSLVEMLITLIIMGFIMLTAATSLTTLIKISTVSSNKTRVRSESEFVLEFVRKTVRNSNPADVYIFKSFDKRNYDPDTNKVVNKNPGEDLSSYYLTTLPENTPGNEIHFRPYGYDSWVCIGFFSSAKEDGMGYILKTSAQNLSDKQETCFDDEESKYSIVLNSDVVNITAFDIAYTVLKDSNYLIRFDIKAEPTEWYLGPGAPVKKELYRQAVVSTEGIVW